MNRFAIHSGLVVGAIAAAVVLGTSAVLGLAPDVPLLVLALCGTWTVYLVERAGGWAPEDRYNHPERVAWFERHPAWVRVAAALGALGAGAAVPLLRVETVAWCVGLGLAGALYVLPVLPQGRRLKSVWYLKPAAVAAAWAVGGVVVPAVEAAGEAGWAVWLLASYRFAFILPNPLVADWLDRGGDARAGLRTVATEWPERRLRRLASSSAVAAASAALAAVALFGAPPVLLVDAAGAVAMAWLVRRPPPLPRRRYLLLLDALVAWPAVTALVYWLM